MKKIKNLQEQGNDIFLLLKNIEQKETKTKKPYLLLTLSDGDTDIKAKVWDMTKESFGIDTGDVACFYVNVGTYNNAPDYTIEKYRAVRATDHINRSDFLAIAPVDPEKLYLKILATAKRLNNATLSSIVVGLYEENKEKIIQSSAAKSVHHNILGGLLWHTYRMINTGDKLCEVYTTANRDLLLAGIMLHDIGKIYELETDDMGNASYTADGSLFGHLLMGIEMVDRYVMRMPHADTESIRLLKAMIAQHHGEFPGSITQPNFLESMLLHECDMIDAKVYQFEKIHRDNEPGSVTEQRYYALGNVSVYTPNLTD